ncbi:hypothetical protein CFC21_053980 [Triticum aestivum]|uniref:RING-type domain-containing protein n=3 Tax=Triticum TaxID=4564 RepID=A0A9R0W2P5_TRITD|nr:hypothetical protein CFC21_053980 [Triticum aestivum]VAH96492.1 unnamed protein product [Triticum turgidum subsp. durum]
MASPLSRMPPLAAAAMECRLSGRLGTEARDMSLSPSKGYYSRVRLHGDLVVSYWLRAVGGAVRPTLQHEEAAPRRFDHKFPLLNSLNANHHSACRDAMHEVLLRARTPLGLDAGSWDDSLADHLATLTVDAVRREHGAGEHRGVPPRFDVDMALTIVAEFVYSEPKALLLACDKAAAATTTTAPPCQGQARDAECRVCMEAKEDTMVRLPCSHSFHRGCILPCFHKVATCPMCGHDVAKYLAAATNTPIGKLPAGLSGP